MALGDAFELIWTHTDTDDKVLQNNFYYRYSMLIDPLGSTLSYVLGEQWIEQIQPFLLQILPAASTVTAIRVRNLFDANDGADFSLTTPGTYAHVSGDDYEPSFIVSKFTLAHDRYSIKKGRRMMSGLKENDYYSKSFTLPYRVKQAIAGTAMVAPVRTSFIFTQDTFEPIVVARVKDIQQDGSVKYRLPNVIGELAYGWIKSAVASYIPTTMNTRKD